MKKPPFRLRTLLALCLGAFLAACSPTGENADQDLTLRYEQPASHWTEALPIGNGFMGAMIYGDPAREQLALNENTLYSGEPSVRISTVDIRPQYDEVCRLIRDGHYADAQDLMARHWQGRLPQSYEPLGNLYVDFGYDDNDSISHYERTLDLARSLSTVAYRVNDVPVRREYFASYPDRVIAMRISSPDSIRLLLSMDSPHPTAHTTSKPDGTLSLRGQAPGYCDRRPKQQLADNGLQRLHPHFFAPDGALLHDSPLLYADDIDGQGMFFEGRIQVLKGKARAQGDKLAVDGQGEVVLLLAASTSYNGMDKSPSRQGADYVGRNDTVLAQAAAQGYDRLLQRHETDYRSLFGNMSLSLDGTATDVAALPTDERVTRFAQTDDPALAALLFQYGRYLLISSSRPGGQPANLQGMWNDVTVPKWNCGYTMNINLEMNYWPAEATGLAECAEPLFDFLQEMSVSGREVAREMYGLPGWAFHHNTSLWREAFPTDGDASFSFWNMAGGWLCRHLWEHYLYTGDRDFLEQTAYPLMEGATAFYDGWLVPLDTCWTTPIAVSPENIFYAPDGRKAAVSMGSTMDMAILRDLFTAYLAASDTLGRSNALTASIRQKLPRLLPYQVGAQGQIQEWMYDFRETEPHHRHLSHLVGLYPGDQLTYSRTPELMEAARRTLELRGDEATGWSMGWKINLWARMQDGNHAYRIVRRLFNLVPPEAAYPDPGGLYPNLMDAHPPFQIDGNFGYTAGVVEMLLQCHDGFLHLLPALPDAWAKGGSVEGLRTRGGFVADFSWKDGRVDKLHLSAPRGGTCRVRVNGEMHDVSLRPDTSWSYPQ